ncbi:hypothetical protein D3C86_1762220 [compost metagenome]
MVAVGQIEFLAQRVELFTRHDAFLELAEFIAYGLQFAVLGGGEHFQARAQLGGELPQVCRRAGRGVRLRGGELLTVQEAEELAQIAQEGRGRFVGFGRRIGVEIERDQFGRGEKVDRLLLLVRQRAGGGVFHAGAEGQVVGSQAGG